MKTTTGKLRNITTGILHTEIGDVYKFFDEYLDMDGIMTRQLPSALRALEPILKNKFPDKPEWFTKEWIKTGLNDSIDLPELTLEEKGIFWDNYKTFASQVWENIKDKTIVVKS